MKKRLIITVMIIIVLFAGACNNSSKINEAQEYGVKTGVSDSVASQLRLLNGLDKDEKKFIDIVVALPQEKQVAIINAVVRDKKITTEEVGWVLYEKGSILVKQKKYDNALVDFNESIRLSPKNYLSYMERGLVYHKKGGYDQAITDFSEVIAFGPKAEIYYYQAYFYRGLCYLTKGSYNEAISDFNKTIEIQKQLNLSIHIYPSQGSLYFFIGKTYYEKKDYPQTVVNIDKALKYGITTEVNGERTGWLGEANLVKAKAHLALKEKDKAKEYLYYALQTSENTQLIKEARDILRQEFGE